MPPARTKPARRGGIATSEVDYSDDERIFLAAVRAYQTRTGKKFVAYSELLAVAVALGYRKVAEPGPMPR